MRKVFGICCVLLGICCLIASVGFIVYNRQEEKNALNASQNILQDVLENIPEESIPKENLIGVQNREEHEAIRSELPAEMLTARVNGYDCNGVLSVPTLELELPVLTGWSYAKRKVAPCHYFGTCYGENFVIAAHNDRSHFGRLSELQEGDLILFTDIASAVHYYKVVLLETLPSYATEEMIASGFDLSLYTCTPGGASRVTVRCNAIDRD